MFDLEIVRPGSASSHRLMLILAMAMLAAGCYWRRYDDLLSTHVNLLEQLATDGRDAMRVGALGPADIERLNYPLARARQFAEIVRGRFGDRASLLRFELFVATYGELVSTLDRLRSEPSDQDSLNRADALVDRLTLQAAEVRKALARERKRLSP